MRKVPTSVKSSFWKMIVWVAAVLAVIWIAYYLWHPNAVPESSITGKSENTSAFPTCITTTVATTVTQTPSTALRTVSVSATTTGTVTVTMVTTTATSAFSPLMLGLSTFSTYVASVVIFAGLGLDLAPGRKLQRRLMIHFRCGKYSLCHAD